jgi:hypothetical protein
MKALLTVICLLISCAASAQEFRRTFYFDFRVIKISDEAAVTLQKDKTFARSNVGERTRGEILDKDSVWYLSPTEGIAFCDSSDRKKAIITPQSITLKAGCRYVLKNVILPQIEVKEKGGTKVVTHVVSPDSMSKATKCYISFDKEKMWVNPYLDKDYKRDVVLYTLQNRQTVTPEFREWTVSTLLLPIKYRFSGSKDGTGFSEDFATSININAFVGFTPFRGVVRYHYREQVGSVTTTNKFMVGALVGASTVVLDKSNTSASEKRITTDEKITKGLLTLGAGATYSINKINFGGFAGFDFSVGDDAARWNYNGQLWVGLAVGYAIFPFAQ